MIAQSSHILIIDGKPATPAELKRVGIVASPVVVPQVDEEYEAWKKEHGLDRPMTAQEVENVARYELAYLDK